MLTSSKLSERSYHSDMLLQPMYGASPTDSQRTQRGKFHRYVVEGAKPLSHTNTRFPTHLAL